MQLKIIRSPSSKTSISGELSVDGIPFCYTLERPDASVEGAKAPFCIPTGTYKVAPRWSEHNKMIVLGINDVPGRTDIEIHIANQPFQIKGCVAVGLNRSTDYVGQSKMAFDGLMAKTKDQDLTLEII